MSGHFFAHFHVHATLKQWEISMYRYSLSPLITKITHNHYTDFQAFKRIFPQACGTQLSPCHVFPLTADPSHKSHYALQIPHNTPFCNRNVHISVTKWCIVGVSKCYYGTMTFAVNMRGYDFDQSTVNSNVHHFIRYRLPHLITIHNKPPSSCT